MATDSDIYISGYSGRFPDSENVKVLFDNLQNKTDCVSKSKRYPEGYLGLPNRAGHMPEIDKFDNLFFKMNKTHVEGMDIQIRMLLEVVYEALVDSKLSIQSLKNTNTGVYVGNCFSDYHNGIIQNINNVNGYENLGSAISMSANKISHFFDLTGPSLAIDTACSSSLHALSIACNDIQSGKIERAIVAGVSLNLRPVVSKVFQQYNMLSPDGTCYSFDTKANGYCRAESINAIILQKGSGYVKIIGHGINANGTTEQGIAFPNVYKQTDLFHMICDRYQIDKSQVEYIEAHGTGTTAGDNAEITALNNVYGCDDKCIHLGSVKSSLGHAEGASGLNSIIKCLMSYETGKLLPNIHYENTTHKPILDGRFKVVTELTDFNRGYSVVNNFGFGGTNAHVVLANGNYNYKEPVDSNIKKVFARTKEQCEQLLQSTMVTSQFFENMDDINKFQYSGAKCGDYMTVKSLSTTPKLAYIYSGQGSNYNHMGKELFQTNQTFQNTILRLDKYLRSISNDEYKLTDMFINGEMWLDKRNSSIGITSVQLGITNILKEQGFVPDYIIGHSMGEIGCSYADGCLTEEQCIHISYVRSLMVQLINKNTYFYNYTCEIQHQGLIEKTSDGLFVYQVKKEDAEVFEQQHPGFVSKIDNHGRMIFVSATEETVKPIVDSFPNVCIACYNSVDGLTLSGPYDDVCKIEQVLAENKTFFKPVETDGIAYHSVLLRPYFSYLMDKFSSVIPVPFKRSSSWLSTSDVSNDMCDALYHTTNIVSSVLFNQQIESLPKDETIAFLEISPNEGMLGQIKRSRKENIVLIPTLSKKTLDQHSTDISKMFCNLWANKVIVKQPTNYTQQLPLQYRYNIAWDHDTTWKIVTYKDFESGSNSSANVVYNLKTDYKFLHDHQIQGKSIFPAMGHIYTIWQMIGLSKPLSLRNFQILKAVLMPEETVELKFVVKRRDISGYDIFYDDELVSSVEVDDSVVKQVERNTCAKNERITDKYQFYGQLSRYGYEYKNTFRMIDSVFENGAHINKVNHWISFLDGMLQTSVQSVDSLYLPTRINRVIIGEPALMLENLDVFVEQKEIYVGNNQVLIDGLETTLAPNVIDANESVKRSVEWVPYHANRADGLDMCVQIINENIKEYTLYDMTSDSKIFPLVENNVSQYNKATTKVDVIFGQNLVDIDTYFDDLNHNGFLLIEVDSQPSFESTKFRLVASYVGENKYLLYRKVVSKEYTILDKLTSGIQFSGNMIFTCACDSFVKSIHREPEMEDYSVVCAYNVDNKLVSDGVVEYAKTTQLLINAEKNGDIGSYRMTTNMKTFDTHNDFEIRVDKPGTLQSLTPYKSVKGDIDVHYTGLNFKDVMLSYGKLKMKHVQLGLEFSGVRDNVPVMGMGLGLFKSTIDTNSVISWEIPTTWKLEDAATIPCVYGTVYYALDYKSHMQKGQSILIHAGAGGIGQAAIHLCLLRGLKVYTTCSENKRQFLKDKFGLADNQIGNSRDNSFYNWIMNENGGVDIVLNSLAEDKLKLSIECVKPFGQFCEIGKYDILQNSPVGLKLFENNVSLHVIDLSCMFAHPTFKNVLKSLVQNGIDKGEIMPLNIDRVYEYSKLDEAIRYMGGGNHMGKIIIKMPYGGCDMPTNVKQQFHTTGTHLITGGMGGFGMELGEWLVDRGATKVLLMGRNGISSLYQSKKFAKYQGIFEYVKGDITSDADVARIFEENKVTGVWHLAMKLNDQLYKNLTDITWQETIDVKERGAQLLNKYSPDDALFVCWSSISSLFGNAGQTNYAHGNNVMELICRERRSSGKHGLSICWGAIDNIGYLSQENSKINKLMFLPQNIDDCLNDLHTILQTDSSVVSCYKVNHSFNKSSGGAEETLLGSVMAIIGVTNLETIDKSTTLTDLGMDSLQSASVKSVLKKFGRDVKPSEVFQLKVSDLM